jgi:FG-GAP repeat
MIATGMGPRPPSSELELDSFASSVAVSAHGEFILVGAAWDSGRIGAAWVFARSGSNWAQQGQKLTPSNPSQEERFGKDVALSGDGATALVGAAGDRHSPAGGGQAEGAAYVFTRSGAAWTQTAKLIDTESHRYETTTEVGRAIGLSADGNTALLGSSQSVLVFTRGTSGWQQHRPLSPSSIAGSSGEAAFGDVLALSASGDQALVSGIPREGCGKYMNEPCSAPTVVWAFDRVGEAWIRQPSPLVAGRSVGGHLVLSANGEIALIRGVTPGPEPGGAVLVSQITPPPQTGFVTEAAVVENEGVLEVALWTPVPGTLKATARIASPGIRGTRGCVRPPGVKHPTAGRRCSVRTAIYGSASARGVENVRLSIAPRPQLTGFLERHKRVRVAITITDQPSSHAPSSTQMIALTVTFRRPPPPEF